MCSCRKRERFPLEINVDWLIQETFMFLFSVMVYRRY